MMLNKDYSDMLRALSDENVKFILVGAYAIAAHGYPCATMDIDGIPVKVLSKDDLITNKKASGRRKELADVEMLESNREERTREEGCLK
jgi:predicted nucleotidyltransferase